MTHYEHYDRLRLSHVKRWHIVATTREQTVAEHSYNVWVLTGFICDALDVDEKTRDTACSWALLHDEPEATIGDIPTPTKRHTVGANIWDQLERSVASDPWRTVADAVEGTLARNVVKIADTLEAWSFLKLWGTGAHALEVRKKLECALWIVISKTGEQWPYDGDWINARLEIGKFMGGV